MDGSFYALISRMRYISRWGLMRNSSPENVQEHSHMVAVLAHALAVIREKVFGISCDANAAAAIALYHDASEILTGDLPTPVKYHNRGISDAYKEIERYAANRLLDMLPPETRGTYEKLLNPPDDGLVRLVKAADKLSAYIKCIEERKAGNGEFIDAERQTREALCGMGLPEVEYFLEHYIPAFEKNLDELGMME